MDRVERGKSSSSPNDNIIILDLKKRGTGGGSFEVTLSDGSSFFITESVRTRHSIQPESAFSPRELEEIKEAAEYELCKVKALGLLGRSSHTRKQMEFKLLKREFSAETVAGILDFLEDRGYIDDRDYAEAWIQSRVSRHPEGRTRLYAGLLKRGIHRSIASGVLDHIAGPEIMARSVKHAAEKMLRKATLSEEILVKKLQGRGFTRLEIRQYLDSDHCD